MKNPNQAQDIHKIYDLDKHRRQRLIDMSDEILDSMKSIDLKFETNDIEHLKNKVETETFKILIIGEFNTGKSTLINALLGAEVLPTKAIPATAIINIIKHGDKPSTALHFQDIEKEPLDVPFDKLSDYVLIQNNDGEEEAKKEIRENLFSHAEVCWPLEWLKENKVEIIDSPGLNENKVREDITLKYLKKVDVVIFIMSAARFGPAKSENDTISQLKNHNHEDLFFVLNQWDLLRINQINDVRSAALKILPKHTNRKDDIYFVSALDALEGRISSNMDLVKKSGFIEFEDALHKFLVNERGLLKSVNGAKGLRLIIGKIEKESIPEKIELLKMPLGKLQLNYQNSQKDLEGLILNQKDITSFLSRQKSQITGLANSRVKEFFFTRDADITQWADEYEFELGLLDLPSLKSKISNNCENLFSYLNEKIEGSFSEWNLSTFSPFIEEQNKSLFYELERKATQFENKLNDMKFSLGLSSALPENISDNFASQSPLERILATAGGWVVGGIGGGAIGAFMGWKEMTKTILPNIATIIATLALSIPVLPAAVLLLIVNIIQGDGALKKLKRTVKEKVLEEYRKNIRIESVTHADAISKQVENHLNELSKAIILGMERRINEINDQVKTALKAHNKGQQEVDAQLRLIDEFKIQINNINEELDEFIVDLVTSKNK
jgi:ribosome biogenesis GTPase A